MDNVLLTIGLFILSVIGALGVIKLLVTAVLAFTMASSKPGYKKEYNELMNAVVKYTKLFNSLLLHYPLKHYDSIERLFNIECAVYRKHYEAVKLLEDKKYQEELMNKPMSSSYIIIPSLTLIGFNSRSKVHAFNFKYHIKYNVDSRNPVTFYKSIKDMRKLKDEINRICTSFHFNIAESNINILLNCLNCRRCGNIKDLTERKFCKETGSFVCSIALNDVETNKIV
jgi:hypothetical protein